MHNLSGFERALDQRNNLLKQISINPELKDTLGIWDDQMISFGSYLIEKRRNFISEINDIAGKIHSILTEDKEKLNIEYLPSTNENSFKEELIKNRERDIFLKSTNIGPHRDDILFIINDNNVKKFGSQGQQRTAALTLKLSEIELVKKRTRKNPVLLLDDVLSELDRSRQMKLLENISGVQTIITCTGLEEFVKKRIKYDKVYKVSMGQISEESL